SYRCRNIALTDRRRFWRRFAFRQLGHCRRTCHCGHAAFGAKTDVGDATCIDSYRQLEDVAARGILDAHVGISAGQLARVARVLEMEEKLRRIHGAASTALLTTAKQFTATISLPRGSG